MSENLTLATGDGSVATREPALVADDISVVFGGLVAVNKVSFTVPDQGIVSLIGPNGAGKTTFFNVLTGLYPAERGGSVMLGGQDVTGLAPHKIASLGLARTFQNIRLFGLMTAEENIKVAMHSHLKSGVFGTVLRLPRQRREEREAHDAALELLRFVGIGRTAYEYARNLSYGDQRRLEVARALALKPKVLLLDEPTAGMNPRESAEFVDFVHRVRDERKVSVLLIEHDMSVVMRVSERITVLDRGEKIAEGTADEVRANPRVVEAYLGSAATDNHVTIDDGSQEGAS
jgi:branched-chain amino acid transport system ATP-binding protein